MMRKLLRRIAYGLGGLAALLLLGAAAGYLYLRGGLPQTEGEVAFPGLDAPVQILRDSNGLVTIKAEAEADAYRALGFVHAQDRLGQMEMTRRIGQGRLSEVAGESTLDFDKLLRILGLYRSAEASVALLSPRNRAIVEAYAEGVNHYLENHEGAWPPEFYAMGISQPEPWRPADSLVWGKLMALQLSGNWREELRNAALDRALSPDQLAALLPELPSGSPTTLATSSLGKTLLSSLPFEMQDHGASNAWVIDGSKTDSGKPILANDPHLMLQAPAVWYLARIETPDWVLAGATAPGVPAVLIGHNGSMAWGFTTTHSDTQDLVIEKLAEGEENRYLTPQGPLPFEIWDEYITLRGGEERVVTLRKTRHGPVISDVSEDAGAALRAGEVLSLAWPGLIEADSTSNAILTMNHAKDPAAFREALREMVAPQQNVFFAHVGGDIGFIAPARVPLRIGYDGSRPVEGWSREALWSGFIPFEELPSSLNPEAGALVNANNKITPADYPYRLATEYQEPYRAERIQGLLEAGKVRSLDDAAAIQTDTRSLMVQNLLPLMLNSREIQLDPDLERIRFTLAAWDGRMSRERPEPLIFSAWLAALQERLFSDELGGAYADFESWHPRSVENLLRNHPNWCDNVMTGDVESCGEILHHALLHALREIEELTGEEPLDAAWGDLHRARMAHPVIGRIPVVAPLGTVELATDGGNYTVSRGTPALPSGRRAYQHIHGAGMRAVFDLANLDNSRFSLSSGQSGHIFSSHFGDLAESWRDGNSLKLVAPEQDDSRRLLLTP